MTASAPGSRRVGAVPAVGAAGPHWRDLLRPAWAVVVRPWLWPVAVAEMLRLARPGWWRRWPPVPLPDGALWRFRMQTAYGGRGDAEPRPGDVVSFLGWCAAMRRWQR